jgi:hypothetical protein
LGLGLPAFHYLLVLYLNFASDLGPHFPPVLHIAFRLGAQLTFGLADHFTPGLRPHFLLVLQLSSHFCFTMNWVFILPLFLWIRNVAAVTNGNFTTLSDAIPQLAGLSLAPPRYPGLGTMNITNCCLFALNDAFAIQDGYLVIIDNSFLSPGTTAESFLSNMDTGQFPCSSSFNGTEVKAPYTWCSIYCPGWQRAQPNNTKQWAFSLISFILPCLAFSTAIARRRRLKVSDVLFKPTLHNAWKFSLTPLRFLIAIIIVTLDVLIWLALCFAFAGPMILSGVFEAFLDSRILAFVGKKGLSKTMSTRLLYLILVGNLDFEWKTGELYSSLLLLPLADIG